MSDFEQQNRDEWKHQSRHKWIDLQNRVFGNSPPSTQEWTSLNDVVRVLTSFCGPNLNHMFFPGSGGHDLKAVTHSSEPLCIELLNGVPNIVRPARLLFETVPDYRSLSYIRLETESLAPSRAYDGYPCFYEDVVEVSPQHYVKPSEWKAGYYLDESGQQVLLHGSARVCARWFTGAFVVFAKGSIYNAVSEMYDGRHAKLTASDFRAYVESLAMEAKQQRVPE